MNSFVFTFNDSWSRHVETYCVIVDFDSLIEGFANIANNFFNFQKFG